MQQTLFVLYFMNAVILIIREIDSAYWKEWHQFKAAFGWFPATSDQRNMNYFLLLHFPLLALVLWGLIEVYQGSMIGLILSLFVGLAGIFAFGFHRYFIRKGDLAFSTRISKAILWAALVVSLGQLEVTVYLCTKL